MQMPHQLNKATEAPKSNGWIRGFAASLRYRVQCWLSKPSKPLSAPILQGVAEGATQFKHMSFTFAIVALSARIACADGELTRGKYIAFRESFPLKGSMCSKIRTLFTAACADLTPMDHYATQIKYIYPDRPHLYASVIGHLFRIATADGTLEKGSERLLETLAHQLEITPATYTRIRASHQQQDARHTFGIYGRSKPQTLKKRYHELMRSYHPDRFSGEELSPELQLLLKVKASEINAAYRTLSKKAA